MTTPNLSRRSALRRLGAFGAAGAAAPWMMNLAALAPAHATGASGYKALVCLFLYGGNDAYNTVLATDTDSWNAYLADHRIAAATESDRTNIAGLPRQRFGASQCAGRALALLGRARDRCAAIVLRERHRDIIGNVGHRFAP